MTRCWPLGVQKSERDLGVIMQSDLKVDKQCSKAANEANKRLGMINRNFKCKAKKVILPLYKSIVRTHLDYCMQAWRPHYRKDIDQVGEGAEGSNQDGVGAGGVWL